MELKQTITDEEKLNRFKKEANKKIEAEFKSVLQLAKAIDHAYPNFSAMLNGKIPLADIVIYKFCEAFQYKPGYFFGRDPFLITYEKSDLSSAEVKDRLFFFEEHFKKIYAFLEENKIDI